MADKNKYVYTKGRRKTAVATLRLYSEKGISVVNETEFEKAYDDAYYQKLILAPFKAAGLDSKNYMFTAKVSGSGFNAQAEAIRHALARAIVKMDPELRKPVKAAGFLTRDPRMVERKKTGLHKARKAEQYSKR